jgi:hypothetical protein
MTEARAFDPSQHLSLISGNEYLEVKWRLVWFRAEHPNGQIDTEMISYQNNTAIFRATVRTVSEDGAVLGSATGHGMEDAQGFGDFLEKAETKAIGRALAALGFGTQFCQDHEFGAANGRVVDSPVAMKAAAPQRQYQNAPGGGGNFQRQGGGNSRGTGRPITESQTKMLWAKANTAGMDPKEIAKEWGVSDFRDLTGQPNDGTVDAIIARIEANGPAGPFAGV